MSFDLFVISSEQWVADEHEVLPQLFAAGLTTFHVRKPGWPRAELEAYLRAIPARYHPRVVLHAHYELALEYPFQGIHLTTHARQQPATAPLLRRLRGRSVSASLHSLASPTCSAPSEPAAPSCCRPAPPVTPSSPPARSRTS